VVAHDRAGDGRHQAEALGSIGHGTQNRPGERCVALLFDPRLEVVRNGCEVEACVLGTLGVVDEI